MLNALSTVCEKNSLLSLLLSWLSSLLGFIRFIVDEVLVIVVGVVPHISDQEDGVGYLLRGLYESGGSE